MLTKTTKEFAEIFGVTEKTVRTWIRDGMPVVKQGAQGAGNESEIDFEAGTRWYFEKNRERLQLDRERTRLASEQADKTALENAQSRGELGVISEMAEFYGLHIDRAHRRLQQIPQTLGQYCDERSSKAVVAACERLIDECVRELATDGREVPKPAVDAVERKTATDSQPVVGRTSKAKRRK